MSSKPRIIIEAEEMQLILNRLAYQMIENHGNFSNTVIVGIRPRGIFLAKRLRDKLLAITKNNDILYGNLDITFYRDDFRRREKFLSPELTNLPVSLEDKKVVLIDDVLFTGRTIRAALDALLDFGRPQMVELLVLIDRRLERHLPIEPNYTGKIINTIHSERVEVIWNNEHNEDVVLLNNQE